MTYSFKSSARPLSAWSTAKRRKRHMRTEREKRRCARIFSSCSRTAEWITAGWVDCDTLYRTLSTVFGPKGNPVVADVSKAGINGSVFAGVETDNAVNC